MFRIGEEEINAVRRVIESGNLFKINNGNREVFRFEEELKEKFDVKEAILMTSGKAALISALIGMGIGPGDEVVVPAYTYIATAIAVTAVGAIPVIADTDETLTLSAEAFRKVISPHTKAVIPVHIQGFPCDLDGILAVAAKHGIKVLEDACQADGGSYHGRRLGTVGNAGALSFNYFKIITAGEGGALLTNDRKIYEKSLIHHDSSAVLFFGDQINALSEEEFCGTEYRVSEITGAILREQLKRLDGILADCRAVKKRMINELSDVCAFAPSHDPEGDCGTTLAFRFENEAEALAFQDGLRNAGFTDAVRPFDTGKHVFTHWTPILAHRGAAHPAMDPFKMEANRGLNMDYAPDMCGKTLDLLARTVYMNLRPDFTEEDVSLRIRTVRKLL